MLNTQATTLPSGLTVLSTNLPDMQTVCVGVWIDVGARDEDAAPVYGASHFLEHMMFKGTRTKSARDISVAIESKGGYLNAFTQEENTCYYAHVPASQTWNALDVLADLYCNATFPRDELVKERDVILEEIRMYRDQPPQLVAEWLDALLWVDHPLGRPIIGNEGSVTKMTRDRLMAYRKRHYVPNRTLVSFAGPIDHNDCIRHVADLFPDGDKKKSPRSMELVSKQVKQKKLTLNTKTVEQAHMALGFRIFGRKDPRRYALRLLNIILGENMSSRLFQVVREKHGLAYNIQSHVNLFGDTGVMVVSAGMERSKAIKTLDLVVQELIRLRDKAIPPRHLTEAREYALGHMSLSLEGTISTMVWSAESYLSNNRVVPLTELIDGLRAVTTQDLHTTAEAVFQAPQASLSLLTDKDVPRGASLCTGILKRL